MPLIELYDADGNQALVSPGSEAHEIMVGMGYVERGARKVPDGMTGKADGTPFASESAATTSRSKQGLTMTHNVVEVDGGWALEPATHQPAFTTQGEPITRG